MIIGRYLKEGKIFYGTPADDGTVRELTGSRPWELSPGNNVHPAARLRLLSPCQPGKIICVGLNYLDHAKELGLPIPPEPILFMKPPSAVIGPEEQIVLPQASRRVDYEAELAVVLGKTARNLKPDEALDYVLGYTCANDITARDLQKKDGQWTRSKSFDTFLPLGPYIIINHDPSDLEITLYLNGNRKQHSSSANLIFNIPQLIWFISSIMTLDPGDVILTGTPSGVGPLSSGDLVEVSIEGIGNLANRVI